MKYLFWKLKSVKSIGYYLKPMVVILIMSATSVCFGQDTLKKHRLDNVDYATSVGFTYQMKDNRSLSTAIFELGTEIGSSFHVVKSFIYWDGHAKDGKRTGGSCYKKNLRILFEFPGSIIILISLLLDF